jgi:transcriptional regulator with XRE-family HTH domain
VTDERGVNAAEIGRRVRALRGTMGLSLRQLAKAMGASPSLLSQIENGKVMPSVDTLYLLADALNAPVAAFFSESPPEQPRPSGEPWVVRAGDRKRIALEHGVTWENLLPREQAGLRFMEIRYAPGAHSGEHQLRHPGRDLFVVLEGELTFEIGFAEHRLQAGDSVSFADFQPHRLRNDGAVDARAVVCVVGDYQGGEAPAHPPH